MSDDTPTTSISPRSFKADGVDTSFANEITRLRAENARLREALEFYARSAYYGNRARAALKETTDDG